MDDLNTNVPGNSDLSLSQITDATVTIAQDTEATGVEFYDDE